MTNHVLFERGAPVIRISLPWMVEVVRAVDGLDSISTGQTYAQVWPSMYTAKNQLEAVMSQSLYAGSLRSSRESANALHATLQRLISITDMQQAISEIDDWQVRNQKQQFRTVFLAELGTLPSYFVLPKNPYDTNILLDNGETLFPPELALKAPEAVFDAKEAGKALAFELGTACGFHTFRALESVVRRYYAAVSGGEAPPKQRNLGVYIRVLEKCKADEKVVKALTQLKDLHRNPLAHPDVAIRVSEATSIIGMVGSVIAAMLDELPEVPQTTTTAGA